MEIINQLNLGLTDKILLLGCPFAAIIGSFANWLILEVNLSEKPITRKNGKITVGLRSSLEAAFVLKWIFFRLLVGGILGLVLALYFIGIIKDDLNSISRLLAFAILLGYAAPKMWISQEKLIQKYIDEQIKKLPDLTSDEKNTEK